MSDLNYTPVSEPITIRDLGFERLKPTISTHTTAEGYYVVDFVINGELVETWSTPTKDLTEYAVNELMAKVRATTAVAMRVVDIIGRMPVEVERGG